MQQPQQLNITVGTDVVLYDRLIFEGETFDPNLSVGIAANLVNSLGKRTALDVQIVDDELLITIPWVEGRLPGCYGLEVTGTCNSRKWSTYADSLIRYTKATRLGVSEVTVESDSYDITMEVGYRYGDGGNINDVQVNGVSVVQAGKAKIIMPTKVGDLPNDRGYQNAQQVQQAIERNLVPNAEVTVDNNVGLPSANVTKRGNTLRFDFRNLKGEPFTFDDLTPEQKAEITGPKGDDGDSAVFDPETGNILATLHNTTGQDDANAMTQKAVTKCVKDIGKEIGGYRSINFEPLALHKCSLAVNGWYMRTSGTGKNMQRHSVIPVTPGDIFLLCNISTDTTDGNGHYAWLTSSYDPETTYTNGDAIPFVDGGERINLPVSDGEIMITAPSDAAYLCINRVDGAGNDVLWTIAKKNNVSDLAKQTQYNAEDCEAATEWVDHGNEAPLAGGYIGNSSLLWLLSSTYQGKLIPFEQYAGKRVSIRTKDYAPRFAFLTALPSNVDQSIVSYCEGWECLKYGVEYDGLVPDDCKYLYVYAYSDGTDRTPYVETRHSIALNNYGEVFTPTESIALSELDEHLCSIGTTYFYYKSTSGAIGYHAQRHIAVPVEPGEIIRVRGVDGNSQVILATDDYDPTNTYSANDSIPIAEGWTGRSIETEIVFTVPTNGAYLLMTTKDGSGMPCTYEVQKGTIESKPSKDLPINTPAKLRVVQWNIGGFTKGTAGDDRGYDGHPEDYANDLPIWKDTINDMDADIICCCEYNDTMIHGINGAPDVIARDEIFGLFRHAYIRPKMSDYNQKAIFSHERAKASAQTTFQQSVSGKQYYEVNTYSINNKDVYVIATHLDWNSSEQAAGYRQAQMEELMTFAEDKEYVIICADFNVGAGTDETARQAGAAEFDQWLEAGWKMANHGYLGDYNTGHRTYSVLDNIIAKGFDVSAIKIYDGDNARNVSQEQTHQLSDHAAIGCTLTMID